MQSLFSLDDRKSKLNKLNIFLSGTEDKLLFFTENINWDYKKLIEQSVSELYSNDSQHINPSSEVKFKKQDSRTNCISLCEKSKFFPLVNHGSCVMFNSELIYNILKKQGDSEFSKTFCSFPNCNEELDKILSREEKLTLYNYVIANTHKKKEFSEVFLEPFNKKKEKKKKLLPWEIAAAERDAKRRRVSYRNKVHTSRKSYTEVLREVINVQMELLEHENTVKEFKNEPFESYSSKMKKKHSDRVDKEKNVNCRKTCYKKDTDHRDHKFSDMSFRKNSFKLWSKDKHRNKKSYREKSHSHKSSRQS